MKIKICLAVLFFSVSGFATIIDINESLMCYGFVSQNDPNIHAVLKYNKEGNLIANLSEGYYDGSYGMNCNEVEENIVRCSGDWHRGGKVDLTFEMTKGRPYMYGVSISNSSSITGGKRVILPFCRKVSR